MSAHLDEGSGEAAAGFLEAAELLGSEVDQLAEMRVLVADRG